MSVPFSKSLIGCIEGSPFRIEAISAEGGVRNALIITI